MQSLWMTLKVLYENFASPCRIQTITPEMIIKNKKCAKPKFKSKGGETRSLVPCVVDLARQYHEHTKSLHSKTMMIMFCKLLDFYMAMSMDEFDADYFAKCSLEFCTLYAALAKRTVTKQYWHLRPKVHMMQELAESMAAELGNPAEFWTYKDESFMGLLASVARSSGGGRRAATMPRVTIDKYRAM